MGVPLQARLFNRENGDLKMSHYTRGSTRRESRKPINIDQVTRYLSATFNRITRNLGFNNSVGTQLYDLQVEFAWLLHEIKTGPVYIVPKHIQTANEMLAELETELEVEEKSR